MERQKVLLAEDIHSIAAKTSFLLEKQGYLVEVAKDGLEAVDKMRKFKPNIFILDIMMPNMHGVEVLKKLKEEIEGNNVCVILCSVKSFEAEKETFKEQGIYAIVKKPLDINEFNKVVDSFYKNEIFGEDHLGMNQPAAGVGEAYIPSLKCNRGYIKLWGSRGSTPVSDPASLRYGGETSCMELRIGDTVIIFDAGSGIRRLGLELIDDSVKTLHLFITHTHWDHIQGFPFFTPIYFPNIEINIYSAKGFRKSIKELFRGQLDSDYFPIQLEKVHSSLNFYELDRQSVIIDDVEITWIYVNHPGATVAYKATIGSFSVVWMPDNEFLQGFVGDPLEISDEMIQPYQTIVDFLVGVDIIVTEAQYMGNEYLNKVGWGHTSLPNAVLLMKLASAKHWIVTHHDPQHNDYFLDDKYNITMQELQRLGHSMVVEMGHTHKTVIF